MNEQLMFTFLQIEYLGYSSFAHYQTQIIRGAKSFTIPEIESTLLPVRYIFLWYGHGNFYRHSQRVLSPGLASVIGSWVFCFQGQGRLSLRTKAWSLSEGSVLTVRAVTQQIVQHKKIPGIKQAVLSPTVAFYQLCYSFDFAVRNHIFTSVFSWVSVYRKMSGRIGDTDLSHALTLLSFTEGC